MMDWSGIFARQLVAALRVLLVVGLLGATAACLNSRGGSVPYDRSDFGRPDTVAPLPAEEYRFGPNDVVTVTVFQVPDLSGDLQVDAKGDIMMPLIGAVPAQGKTAAVLAKDIERALSLKYLQSPSVRVAAKEVNPKTITVDGSVTQPGVYPVTGPITLIRAVALARGTTQDANPKRVVVFRMIDGKRNAAAFDLEAIRRAQAEDPVVYGEDVIVVDGSNSRSTFQTVLQTIPLLAIFTPF